MAIDRSKLTNIYRLVIKTPARKGDLWSWEILRRSKPIGIRIHGTNFQSESAARVAGQKALDDLLDGIFLEGD
jgi:hypothetical protein